MRPIHTKGLCVPEIGEWTESECMGLETVGKKHLFTAFAPLKDMAPFISLDCKLVWLYLGGAFSPLNGDGPSLEHPYV
jgi:hypothetical protein